ncbi:uncharacterized protein METZ01_LOCUS420234 [marine metagenome]|uniref:Uncharacterized protein n=1 Tax=marine metagenome TaxID=408172 RepID=A0A382X947_9ZZZZ
MLEILIFSFIWSKVISESDGKTLK